jgi:glycosyltransferase involved in cell wall biosynthesis
MNISIITPTFNSEKTLSQTLDSVLNQSELPYEHIIIDGLSNDRTLQILENYKLEAPYNVIIRSESDKGIYDAMNKGIDLSTGDVVGIINSDDWYEENAFAAVNEIYKESPGGVYYGILRHWLDGKEFYIDRVNPQFLAKRMVLHPSTFVSKIVYEEYGQFEINLKYSADLELFIRYYISKVAFYPMENIIANFRIGGASSCYKAALETLSVRKRYGMINRKEYYKKKTKYFIQNFIG